MPTLNDITMNVGGNFAPFHRDLANATRIGESQLARLKFDNRSWGALGSINRDLNQFQRSLEASTARTLAFGLSAGAFYALQRGLKGVITSAIDVEKQLADINIVLNLSDKNLQRFGQQVFKTARDTGQSFQTAALAFQEFSRQGLGVNETLKRSKDALMLVRVTGITVEEAVSSLTSVIKTFSDEALDSTKIINTLAAVDQAFAISSKDLIEALKRVGNTASEAGVDFRELISLITALKERTGQAAPVIGNSLKTIFTRLESPTRRESLRTAGISLEGDAIEVITRISKLFQSGQMSREQQSAVKELVSGVYQIDRFTAAIKDLGSEVGTYANAWKIAGLAQDNAIEKNEQLNRTLDAQVKALKANILQFSATLGETGGGPIIKAGLGTLNTLLGNINDKDAEDAGAKWSKGFIAGIGQVLSGPVLLTAMAVIGVYLGKFLKDLGKVAQSVLSINSPLEKQKLLHERISAIIESEGGMIKSLLDGETTTLRIEKDILATLTQQNAQRVFATNLSKTIASRIIVPTGQETLARIGQPSRQAFQPQFLQSRSITGEFAGSIRNQISNLSAYLTTPYNRQALENDITGAFLRAKKGTLRRDDFEKTANFIAKQYDPKSEQLSPYISQILKNATLITPKIANKINAQLQIIADDASRGGANFKELNRVLMSIVKKANLTNAQMDEINAINQKNFKGGVAAFNVNAEDQAIIAQQNSERRRRRMSNIGFGLGIGVPILASSAAQFLPNQGRGGRIGQAALSGIGDAASFGFLGNMIIPGGSGLAIGATIASLLSITKIFEQWNTNLPELETALEAAREKTSLLSDKLNIFVRDVEALKRVEKGELKLSPMEISDTRRRMFQTLATEFTSNERGRVAGFMARGDIEGINKITYESISKQQKLQNLENARLSLEQFLEKKGTTASKTVDQFLNLSDVSAFGDKNKMEKTKGLISNILQLPTQKRELGLGIMGTAVVPVIKQVKTKFQETQLNDISEIFKSLGMENQAALSLSQQFENAPIEESFTLFSSLLRSIKRYEEGLSAVIEEQNKIDPTGILKELGDRIAGLQKNLSNVIVAGKIGAEGRITSVLNFEELQQTKERGQIEALRATSLPFEIGGSQTERVALRRENVLRQQQIESKSETDIIRAREEFSSKILQSSKFLKELGEEPLLSIKDREAILSVLTSLNDFSIGVEHGDIKTENISDKIRDISKIADILKGRGNKSDININALTDELISSFKEFRSIESNINDNQKDIVRISEAQLNAQLLSVKLQEQVDQRTIQQYFDGKAFKDAFIQARTNTRQNRILSGAGAKEVLGGAGQAFAEQWEFPIQEMYKELQDGAAEVGASMKSSFKDAFKSFVDGTRNAEDALNDFGLAIFNKLLDKSLDAGINALFGGITKGASLLFGAQGGYVQGYASGGLVRGGSGNKDDVPAKLSAGEFIVKKSSVQKYGIDFLDNLNRTHTKKFEEGGVNISLANRFDYNDPRRPTAGQRVIDPRLSNFALSDENSVKNNLRINREDTLQQYLSDWNEYDRQNKEIMNNFKRGQQQRLIGAYINAAIISASFLLKTRASANTESFYQSGSVGYSQKQPPLTNVGYTQSYSTSAPSNFSSYGMSYAGGRSAGGLADNVPALLMGGEYIMSKPAVQKYGTDFFHKLNSGQLQRFQMGGSVGGNTNPNPTNPTSMPVNNHVEVNVYITNNEPAKSNINSTTNDPNKTDKERGRLLGESIQASVISIINKESRDGGLLSQTFVRKR